MAPHRPRQPGPPRRIRNIRLVSVSDPGYREYMARLKAESYTLGRKRPPTASQLVAGVAESAIRLWLSRNTTLTENRVLAYQVQEGRFGYRDTYRELDAVACHPETSAPSCVYEVKCSRRPSIISTAAGQVRYTLSLLGKIWPDLAGCVVFVNFSRGQWGLEIGGPVGDQAPKGKIVVPPGLAGKMATWYRVGDEAQPTPRTSAVPGVTYVVVDRDWVRALASEWGLLPDPGLWVRAEQEEETPDPAGEDASGSDGGSGRDREGGPGDDGPWLYSTEDEDAPGDSPLALALKKAGLGGDK